MLPSVLGKPTAVDVGIPADQYLVASLRVPGMTRTNSADDRGRPAVQRVADAHQELITRLAAERGFGPVAIANALPGWTGSWSRTPRRASWPTPYAGCTRACGSWTPSWRPTRWPWGSRR